MVNHHGTCRNGICIVAHLMETPNNGALLAMVEGFKTTGALDFDRAPWHQLGLRDHVVAVGDEDGDSSADPSCRPVVGG